MDFVDTSEFDARTMLFFGFVTINFVKWLHTKVLSFENGQGPDRNSLLKVFLVNFWSDEKFHEYCLCITDLMNSVGIMFEQYLISMLNFI